MSEQLYKSPIGLYSLSFPENWKVEENQEFVTFSEPQNGVGALQISSYSTPEKQSSEELLLDYLSENGVVLDQSRIITKSLFGANVAHFEFIDLTWYRRVWFICRENYLLFVTYNCKIQSQNFERAQIERIIGSIRVGVGDVNFV